MWTEKRLLKALATDFKQTIRHLKEEIEQTQKEATDLIMRAKVKYTKEIMRKRVYIEGLRREIGNFVEVIDYMVRNDAQTPRIYGVSPKANCSVVSDKISVVMERPGFTHIPNSDRVRAGYFAIEANMGDAFLDGDTSKLATAYVRTCELQGGFNLSIMVSNLVMYHFLRRQFVRLRGNQAVNFIRSFRGETIILAEEEEFDSPYIVRNVVIEKAKKTKRGKVTLCHLHLNRSVNGNSGSITLNICHNDSYYRDAGRRHLWSRTKSGFHPVICVADAIFRQSFEKFLAGY